MPLVRLLLKNKNKKFAKTKTKDMADRKTLGGPPGNGMI
jgi:hypothetical protein